MAALLSGGALPATQSGPSGILPQGAALLSRLRHPAILETIHRTGLLHPGVA